MRSTQSVQQTLDFELNWQSLSNKQVAPPLRHRQPPTLAIDDFPLSTCRGFDDRRQSVHRQFCCNQVFYVVEDRIQFDFGCNFGGDDQCSFANYVGKMQFVQHGIQHCLQRTTLQAERQTRVSGKSLFGQRLVIDKDWNSLRFRQKLDNFTEGDIFEIGIHRLVESVEQAISRGTRINISDRDLLLDCGQDSGDSALEMKFLPNYR